MGELRNGRLVMIETYLRTFAFPATAFSWTIAMNSSLKQARLSLSPFASLPFCSFCFAISAAG